MKVNRQDFLYCLAIRLALTALVVPVAMAVWSIADPTRYDRPSSLFFRNYTAPVPPVPAPPPVYRYVAEAGLGSREPAQKEVHVPADSTLINAQFLSKEIPSADKRPQPRGPLAIAFLADCTGSMSHTDSKENRFVEPGKLAAKLGDNDIVSFLTFSAAPAVLKDWAPAKQVEVPKGVGSNGGASTESSVEPITGMFDTSETEDRTKVAVILSDLGGYDGTYVLRAAKALVDKGVQVFTIRFAAKGKFGAEKINPELIETCRSLGGDVFDVDSADDIGSMVERIGQNVIRRRNMRYSVRVEVESKTRHRKGDRVTMIVDGRPVDLVVTGP